MHNIHLFAFSGVWTLLLFGQEGKAENGNG